MAYLLTFCLTLAAGLLGLALFRSRSKPEEPGEHPPRQVGRTAASHHEERASANADVPENANLASASGSLAESVLVWLRLLALLATPAYFVYVVYSDIDQTGLTAWIASLSMRLFGASYDFLNILLGWALYFPAAALLRRCFRFIVPRPAEWNAQPVPAPRRAPRVPSSASPTSGPTGRRYSGSFLLVVFVVGLILSFGLFAGAVAFSSWRISEQHRPFAPALDLDTFSGAPPTSPRVELRGWFHDRLAARYTSYTDRLRSGGYETDHTFTPVTSSRWKAGDPVSVFLENSLERRVGGIVFGRSFHWNPGGDPSSSAGQHTEEVASAPDVATLNVRLRKNDLPYFVEDAYTRAGVRISHPYWVAYTDADETVLALTLVGAFLISLFGLTFVPMRLGKRAQRSRAV